MIEEATSGDEVPRTFGMAHHKRQLFPPAAISSDAR
jgi:hypothetical protein